MHHSRSSRAAIDELARLDSLNGVPRRELAAVDKHSTPVFIPAGRTLCWEGHFGREAFIIVSGDAEVTINGAPVARLTAGMFCGEMALLERGARSATVTAITPMSLLAMSATDFNILVTTAPTFTRRLLETLSTRLRTATDHATAG